MFASFSQENGGKYVTMSGNMKQLVVHELKQILVPREVAKVIIYFRKALVMQNKTMCDSKVTFES